LSQKSSIAEDLQVKTRSMLKKQKQDQTDLIQDLKKVGGDKKVIQELSKDICVSLHKDVIAKNTQKMGKTA
jgi:hypothetical protein